MGIRAFNVIDEIISKNKVLWKYIKQGGTLIIQYNTTRWLKINEITPYKLKLSRDRITDERSKFKILNNSHPIFNYPNKIEKNHELKKYQWQKPHQPNLTGTDSAYYPNKNKNASEKEIVGLMKGLSIVAKKLGISSEVAQGYRTLSNISEHGGQEVPHLHFHIFGGESVGKMVQWKEKLKETT